MDERKALSRRENGGFVFLSVKLCVTRFKCFSGEKANQRNEGARRVRQKRVTQTMMMTNQDVEGKQKPRLIILTTGINLQYKTLLGICLSVKEQILQKYLSIKVKGYYETIRDSVLFISVYGLKGK